VIEDRDPELLRRPKWMAHPNAAVGISRLHFVSQAEADSEPKAEWLRAVNAALPQQRPAALLAIELSVDELQTARCALDAGGIDYHALAAHSVVVEPRVGLGCGLVFVSSGG
jgi:hypothetical protein